MANQMTITFNVDNQTLSRTDTNKIVEKSKNYLYAIFTFSEDWDNINKAIIFENNILRYKIYLDSNNKCQVPNRIIRNDGFTISVVGEDSENFVTITTSELYIGVGKSSATEEDKQPVYEILSHTLDVERNEGTYNIDLPKQYIHETSLECSGYFNGYIDIDILIPRKEAFTDYKDLLQYVNDYRVLNGIGIYNDRTGEYFNFLVQFLYDKNDESQEIDFTGYGVDEDNLIVIARDNIIELDVVTMNSYTPREIN